LWASFKKVLTACIVCDLESWGVLNWKVVGLGSVRLSAAQSLPLTSGIERSTDVGYGLLHDVLFQLRSHRAVTHRALGRSTLARSRNTLPWPRKHVRKDVTRRFGIELSLLDAEQHARISRRPSNSHRSSRKAQRPKAGVPRRWYRYWQVSLGSIDADAPVPHSGFRLI
jgi:hypothetical protein